jgi:hypothetical protein
MKAHSKRQMAILGISLLVLLFAPVITATIQAAEQAAPQDRNFGFFMVRSDLQLEAMHLVHTTWVRMGGVAVWNLIEEQPGSGVYDYSVTDAVIQKANDLNLMLVLTFDPQHLLDKGACQKALPHDMNAYKAFLGAFVERYDGDGFEDAPRSPVVQYWQIGNEPDNETVGGEKVSWNDTPENYAFLLKESAEVIHEADPGAAVLMAGMVDGQNGFDNFYEAVFRALDTFGGGPHFDIFDVHWFSDILENNHYKVLNGVVDTIKGAFEAHGYEDISIWATEVATYSGTPDGYPTRTEDEQARDLARMLLHYRALNIEKIFWAPYREYHEWQGVTNGYFDNTGIVNNPLNDGKDHGKKAYYTYRFLTNKLDGAIFKADSPLVERLNNGVLHFYEFANYGRTYYVFWVDNPSLVGEELPIPTDAVAFKLYSVVPDVNNHIASTVVQNSGGKVYLTLGLNPVLAEYIGEGPSLEIVSPINGMITHVPDLDLSGRTDPLKEVLLEGPYGFTSQAGTADADGNFNFLQIPLSVGDNVLTVTVGTGEHISSETVHVIFVDVEAPVITGTTVLADTDDTKNPYAIATTVSDNSELTNVNLYYKIDSHPVVTVSMADQGGGLFRGEIPPQPLFTLIGYWIEAVDTFGNSVYDPPNMPEQIYSFRVVPQGTTDVVVEVLPIKTRVPRGDSLEVDFNLRNLSYLNMTVNLRLYISAPNGVQKNLVNLDISLPPAAHRSRRLTISIPENAPEGTYFYSAVVSDTAGVELGKDEFPFEVTL